MKIIVTGGCGFIGSHVVEALRKTEHEVLTLDLTPGADLQVDICTPGVVEAVFMREKPDVVFHIAAIADARAVLQNPVRAMEVNVMGTTHVMEAARHSGVSRVIFSSTCWVANAMESGILDEDARFSPGGADHIYTTTKMVGEFLAHDYQKLYGLNFTVLRYGIPYGPRMWPGLVLRNWCQNASEGRPLTIFGDGSAARRFVYVGDLADAHVRALTPRAVNRVYNLEGMREVSIKELAEVFQEVWPGDVGIEYKEDTSRRGELALDQKILSNHRAFVELGWEPRVDLQTGIQRVVDWYMEPVPAPSLVV